MLGAIYAYEDHLDCTTGGLGIVIELIIALHGKLSSTHMAYHASCLDLLTTIKCDP